MKRLAYKVTALLLVVGTVMLPSVATAKQPGQYVLTPQSETALIVIKSDWWEPALEMASAYKLMLSAYNPESGTILGGPYSGGSLIEAKRKSFVEGYLVARIKPGRWVFQSYSQQDRWALCFNAHTMQFEVKAGEVVYLGRLDAYGHRRDLQEQAVRSGKISMRGSEFADFFDLPNGPRLAPIDEQQIKAVSDMIARNILGISAPIRAAVYTPAQFGTGSTLFAERKCGGYFAAGVYKKGDDQGRDSK